MSDSKSRDESRHEHRQVLGDDLGEVYDGLYEEFFWLQLKWQEYMELFGSSPQRIDLLNEAAPAFFRHLQETLWRDLLLHLCRLTDPPRSNGRSNLTFAALPELVAPEVRPRVTELVEVAIGNARFARDWRNRRLAHHDLVLALEGPAAPLQSASRKSVDQALTGLHRVLSFFSEHYFSTQLLREVGGAMTGAKHLLYVLRDGVRASSERRARLEAGEYRPEDWGHDVL